MPSPRPDKTSVRERLCETAGLLQGSRLRCAAAEKDAATRRKTDGARMGDAERLISTRNERQVRRMPMLFSPTIGAAITAGYWFLWLRGKQPHSHIVVSFMPAECAVCRARAAIADQHRRRNARGAPTEDAW
jgi:hypothetical protein